VEGWLSVSDLLRLFQQESGKSGTPGRGCKRGGCVYIKRETRSTRGILQGSPTEGEGKRNRDPQGKGILYSESGFSVCKGGLVFFELLRTLVFILATV